MQDKDVIQQAYEEQLAGLFKTMAAAISGGEDAAAAQQRFKDGVALLRQVRDKALASL